MDAMTPLELKEARISLGFTQEKLAIELGVHRFTVHRWESGEHKIPRMLDLALKQLEREHRRLGAAQRRRADRRKQVKSEGDTARTSNGSKSKST
jgi:DNA-binding XRE family transcriptional regulator